MFLKFEHFDFQNYFKSTYFEKNVLCNVIFEWGNSYSPNIITAWIYGSLHYHPDYLLCNFN